MKIPRMLALFMLLLLVVLLLSACGSKPVQPTHFVCYQQGVVIVDTITVDGANLRIVKPGLQSVQAWTWDDATGYHFLANSDSVACSESEVKE